jgi:hypothetical protein
VSGAEAALLRRLAPESAHKIDYFNLGVDSDFYSALNTNSENTIQ